MPETIPIKKQNGLPPWFGAFTPTERISHAYNEPPHPRGRRCYPACHRHPCRRAVRPAARCRAIGTRGRAGDATPRAIYPACSPGCRADGRLQCSGGNETEEEYLAVRGRISDQQHHKKLSDGGARAEDERTDAAWDGINNDLYPLVDDILAKPAKTLPGLAVQARAISAAAEDLWAGYSGNTHEFEFICRVCQFLGVIPLHTEVHAGL
jgi:hypothetical protein